jgi:hypothetical protein
VSPLKATIGVFLIWGRQFDEFHYPNLGFSDRFVVSGTRASRGSAFGKPQI